MGQGRLMLEVSDHTQGHNSVGMTPLDEGSACRRELYLATHNIHNRQTSMPPVGFKPAIPASDWPQILALDVSATGIGNGNVSGLLTLALGLSALRYDDRKDLSNYWCYQELFNPSCNTVSLELIQPLTEEKYHEYHLGSKGGRYVGLTTLPPSCIDWLEIPGTSNSCGL